ncbi:uncharacterized protein si:ch211-142k18.1, partial [Engraulis encrasicolus]|uniref:uncharacterized protein si:ch211-142k18.1 n=1 Tax=Engraulis encrasicolus TaxID=184585 RepID=UPI002FD14327
KGKSEPTFTTNATATTLEPTFATNATATTLLTLREVGDDPIRSGDAGWPPPFFQAILLDKDEEKGEDKEEDKEEEEEGGECSVNFNTSPMWARQVKAYKDELAYLKAIQHGNQAVMENLVQFVGAEMGDQRYQDVIEENIAGVRQEYSSCSGVVDKTEEELQSQLEGHSREAMDGMQKIKEESLAFADMLHAASDIAGRLESTSKALHASLSQLKHSSVRRGLSHH